MGKKRNVYRSLVKKTAGTRPLERPRRRWMDNIKVGLVEIGWSGEDWLGLDRDRCRVRVLVIAIMNLLVP
jgi:hypothetical protein